MNAGATDDALELFLHAISLADAHPERPYAYALRMNAAFVHAKTSRFAAALPLLNEALAFNDTVEVKTALAYVLLYVEDFEAAVAAYEEVVARDGHLDRPKVLVFMGDAYVALNDHENAARAFRMAFEALPDRSALNRLGLGLRRLNTSAAAAEEAELYAAAVESGLIMDPRQRPPHLSFDVLPAQPWYSEDELPWLAMLNAGIGKAVDEFERLWPADGEPPVDVGADYYDVGAHGKFVHDRALYRGSGAGWKQLVIWENGEARGGAAVFEETLMLLFDAAPEALDFGRVLFSRIEPGMHIVPHVGPTNERLTVHCGMRVPSVGTPAITVGGIARAWERGKCFVFDDSFEHEVVFPEDADSDRVILLFHVPHPVVSARRRRHHQRAGPHAEL